MRFFIGEQIVWNGDGEQMINEQIENKYFIGEEIVLQCNWAR